jgi:hypothetical protein
VVGQKIEDFFNPSWLPHRTPSGKTMMIVTPSGRDNAEFIRKLYRDHYHQPVWDEVIWPMTAVSNTQPLALFQGHGTAMVRNLLELHKQTFVSPYTSPEWVLHDTDPRRKNKIARKNRDGVKASQNATGRKWWEHR